MGKIIYLLWLAIFVWAPGVVLYLKFPHLFRGHGKTLFFVAAGSVLFSLPWDYLAARLGIWSFSPVLTLGLDFGGLPLEELLLYISLGPLVAVTTLLVHKDYER